MLISSNELMEQIKKPSLVLIDCRSYKDYLEGHIPGAVNLDFFHYHWFDTSKDGIKAFEKQMENLLSFLGVTKDKTVVFYDDVSGMSAARGVWLSMYFSHENTFMLDGGFKKWKRSGLVIETKTNGFKPEKFSGKINKEMIAGYEYINKKIGTAKILDTRSRDEYDGNTIRAARKGHIPTAVNIDWILNINEDGTMKSLEDLAKMYDFSKNDEIIVYCQGGYRAANSFLVLKMLGFKNVKVYLGSWGEWGNKLDLPVELNQN
ncbi:sulfurtransferase [Candidatus Nitrosotalea okcheonensis]|uniref:Sulfurtransferase n=1 Tax=Candidatus Nitrosotalea okcheonensis TaxID=1903276 RepID=A0A2H1FGU7_9ARCH|nr:sulfurtransferase [Candidatus Nitrosotalea okcheonensis]SMH71977.1 Sulfurtransferase [Candidatus Nitrosotalea okcheonensis]